VAGGGGREKGKMEGDDDWGMGADCGAMATHKAIIDWNQTSPEFTRGKYSREHTWSFDGGLTVPASAAPSVVPAPYSNPANVDPEEAFVASLASCHMLTFLHLASRRGFKVEGYRDEAVGEMGKNERGIPWVSVVTLNPRITYGGDREPSAEEAAQLHHAAHEQCYVANSVKTEVRVAGGTG
jgi:organic hydroperoxide reductase OsmC/OhrA